MMALTQENVHYTLNSGPGVMNKSTGFMRGSRNFRQAVGGGGGVENSLDNVFLVINLFYSLQSGFNGFITEGGGGIQRNPYNL